MSNMHAVSPVYATASTLSFTILQATRNLDTHLRSMKIWRLRREFVYVMANRFAGTYKK